MQPLPAIGLSGYFIYESEPVGGVVRGGPGQTFDMFCTDYTGAVQKSGGLPFTLPRTTDPALIRAYIQHIDGLVVSGGEDVDPAHYGQQALPGLGKVDPDRDRFELALAEAALAAGVPILGICRGLQLLNVLLGGTLHQDLPPAPDRLSHMASHGPRWLLAHDVELTAGSLLHRLFGQTQTRTNSFHHQAVDRPGRGLRITARARDGICEALESAGNDDFLAVQWHPETMVIRYDDGLVPFRWLIGRAALRQAGRQSSSTVTS